MYGWVGVWIDMNVWMGGCMDRYECMDGWVYG